MQIVSRFKFAFSHAKLSVPIVDVQPFLTDSPTYAADCKQVASALHKYGCLIIKDPRVQADQNNRFLDMMEKYFLKRSTELYAGRTVPDIFPQYDFQVGATPEYAERAKEHAGIIGAFSKDHEAVTPIPVPHDAKWRYFWNIGQVTDDIIKNQPPADFPQFQATMNTWGQHMIDGCNTVAEMAAIGLGLQRKIFTDMMEHGPHKLAPTGSDLLRYKVGTVFAGFHYDFNFLTIHGKSRYPGLFAWLRTGQKFSVSVPEGHLLLQAGKQFEWLTGGYINCGYHEVIYTEQVEKAKDKAVKQGKIPWRVSSTLFSHLRSNVIMKPLKKFSTPQADKKYPSISSADFAKKELQDINLKRS